jgi:hypothetical protein
VIGLALVPAGTILNVAGRQIDGKTRTAAIPQAALQADRTVDLHTLVRSGRRANARRDGWRGDDCC